MRKKRESIGRMLPLCAAPRNRILQDCRSQPRGYTAADLLGPCMRAPSNLGLETTSPTLSPSLQLLVGVLENICPTGSHEMVLDQGRALPGWRPPDGVVE